MERRTWIKLVLPSLLLAAVAVGIYFRWSPIGQSSDPLARWGRGNPTLSEGAYYSSRINRIIENWGRTRLYAATGKDARFKESYKTALVVDLDKQALWIEDGGQIRENDYAEFPAGMKWKFYHATPQGNKELSGRIVLKMRGINSDQQTPEVFNLLAPAGAPGTSIFNSTRAVAEAYITRANSDRYLIIPGLREKLRIPMVRYLSLTASTSSTELLARSPKRRLTLLSRRTKQTG